MAGYGSYGYQYPGMPLPSLESMSPVGYWYGSGADGPYGADQSRMMVRPDGYYPFQSILEPDGRHAYNPSSTQCPQFHRGYDNPSWFYANSMPNPYGYPVDVPMERCMNSQLHYGGYMYR